MIIDPFGARIEGGKLFGRGACDIKGGMAAMLTAFARLVRERPARGPRLVMACSVDEEHTFLGVQRLVRDNLAGGKPGPIHAVVAEPTRLRIVNAHKGVVRWTLTTTGRSCHSSRPEQGVNAIYRMARVLPHVEAFAEKLRSLRTDAQLGPATLSIGVIEGGSSVNTVPDRCRVDVDRRLLPGEDPQSAPGELHEYLQGKIEQDLGLISSVPFLHCPALSSALSAELTQRLGQTIDQVIGSHLVESVPYGTDASTLALAGIPSVVFGPGDIAQAHTCDEWIDLAELGQASEILYRLAKNG
jgi:acetylornithine deacetylase